MQHPLETPEAISDVLALHERFVREREELSAMSNTTRVYCDVTRSVSKTTEIERRGGKRWDKPKKAEKSRDCGGGKF